MKTWIWTTNERRRVETEKTDDVCNNLFLFYFDLFLQSNMHYIVSR